MYTYHGNFRAFRGLIAAQYSGAKVKVAADAPDFVIGETNKSEDFLKKFPLGKVRVLRRQAVNCNCSTYIFITNLRSQPLLEMMEHYFSRAMLLLTFLPMMF